MFVLVLLCMASETSCRLSTALIYEWHEHFLYANEAESETLLQQEHQDCSAIWRMENKKNKTPPQTRSYRCAQRGKSFKFILLKNAKHRSLFSPRPRKIVNTFYLNAFERIKKKTEWGRCARREGEGGLFLHPETSNKA